MIELVKENPCTECGIKGLYENCEDKCVQYRKWYQYQKGRADAYEEVYNRIDEGLCELCECRDVEHKCFKNCQEEIDILKKWLKGKINE